MAITHRECGHDHQRHAADVLRYYELKAQLIADETSIEELREILTGFIWDQSESDSRAELLANGLADLIEVQHDLGDRAPVVASLRIHARRTQG